MTPPDPARRRLLAAGLALLVPTPLSAEGDRPRPRSTLKERLGDKASDEQRVDDCGVPLERRGPRKRPGCPGEGERTDAREGR